MIPVLLGITILLFSLFQLAPGNPLASLHANPDMTPEARERMEEQYGLNQPIHMQYFDYMGNLAQGDMGMSIQYRRDVSFLISHRIGPTFLLSFSAFLLALVVAIPAGIISATRQYTKVDNLFTVFALIGLSIPNFFFGLIMIRVFSVGLGAFPTGGMQTSGADFPFPWNVLDLANHLVLPAIVLGLTSAANFMRYTRSSMLEVVKQDYIRTARAKGLKERIVIYKHALRNALIPIITLMGFQLPMLFSGSLIVEIVFSWPGMGRLAYTAVTQRDYPLMMGVNLFLAVFILLGNLLADIAYAFVDPRIRYN